MTDVTVGGLFAKAGIDEPADGWAALARHGADVGAAWREAADPAALALIAYGATVDPRRILRAIAAALRELAAALPSGMEGPPLDGLDLVEQWDDGRIDSGEAMLLADKAAEACRARGKSKSLAPPAEGINAAIFVLLGAVGHASNLVGINMLQGISEAWAVEVAGRLTPLAIGKAATMLRAAVAAGASPGGDDSDGHSAKAATLLRSHLPFTLIEAGLAGAVPHRSRAMRSARRATGPTNALASS